jgi:hypothetical protein
MPKFHKYLANVISQILVVILVQGCTPITTIRTSSNVSLKVENLSNNESPDSTIEHWLQVQDYDLFKYASNKITDLNPRITIIDSSQYWDSILSGKTGATLQLVIDNSVNSPTAPDIDYLVLLQCRTIWCPWDWSTTVASSFIYDLRNSSVVRQTYVQADGKDWAIPVFTHFRADTDKPAIDALLNDAVDALSGDANMAILWLTENNLMHKMEYEKDIYRTEGVCWSTLYILPCYKH